MTKDEKIKDIKIGDTVRGKLKTVGHPKELVGKIEEIDISDGTVKVCGWWVSEFEKVNDNYISPTGYWL